MTTKPKRTVKSKLGLFTGIIVILEAISIFLPGYTTTLVTSSEIDSTVSSSVREIGLQGPILTIISLLLISFILYLLSNNQQWLIYLSIIGFIGAAILQVWVLFDMDDELDHQIRQLQRDGTVSGNLSFGFYYLLAVTLLLFSLVIIFLYTVVNLYTDASNPAV